MKLTLQQVIVPMTLKAIETLSTESFVPKNQIWPLAKTMAKIRQEMQIWNDARNVILDKYKVEKDGKSEIPPEKLEEINNELQTVLQSEVTIPLQEAIKIPSTLPDSAKVNAQDLAMLYTLGLVTD
jgi:hypothetical protein